MNHTGYRILHTSDWHLGNSLHDHSRIEEYRSFLAELKKIIVLNEVDALLVSGDIFDTGSPSNAALELYYSFLTSLNGTCCKNVVVTAGNHDSPATLNATRELLELLNVKVVATPDAEKHFVNEVFALPSEEAPQVIVCAAPFLRDAALQSSLGSEKFETDEQFVRAGTKAHFEKLQKLALELSEKLGKNLPIVAMAHLYAAGAAPSENADDTEYTVVGNLENVNSEIFPPVFDYVALGHIHRSQKVAGEDRIRYSGSPLPMGFDEARSQSEVLLVDLEEGKLPVIRPMGLSLPRKLVTISGADLSEIREKVLRQDKETPGAWIRVQFTGAGTVGSLRQNLAEDFKKTSLELVHAEYVARVDNSHTAIEEEKDLSEFSPTEVFTRRMENEKDEMGLSQNPELKARVELAFQEILKAVQEGQVD